MGGHCSGWNWWVRVQAELGRLEWNGILTGLLSNQYAFIVAILAVEFSICQLGEDAAASKSEDKRLGDDQASYIISSIAVRSEKIMRPPCGQIFGGATRMVAQFARLTSACIKAAFPLVCSRRYGLIWPLVFHCFS